MTDEKAQLQLEIANEQHKELLKIQQSIEELGKIFVEMSILLQEQDSLLLNIAENVESAEANLECTSREMNRATKYAERIRLKKRMLLVLAMIFLAAIICAIVIPIVLSK